MSEFQRHGNPAVSRPITPPVQEAPRVATAAPQSVKAEPKISINKGIELDAPVSRTVIRFEMKDLKAGIIKSYQEIKEERGPLAMTDPDRTRGNPSASRFALSPLVREPLRLEEEEHRAVEDLIRSRVAELDADVREKANKEGYSVGYAEGKETALKEFRDEGAIKLARVEQLIQSMEEAKVKVFNTNETFLMDLVYRVAKRFLLKDMEVDRTYLTRLVREVVEQSGVREGIRIVIHPKDINAIESIKEGLRESLGQLKNIRIEASAECKEGGCLVETDLSSVDASLRTQFQRVFDGILGAEIVKQLEPEKGEHE